MYYVIVSCPLDEAALTTGFNAVVSDAIADDWPTSRAALRTEADPQWLRVKAAARRHFSRSRRRSTQTVARPGGDRKKHNYDTSPMPLGGFLPAWSVLPLGKALHKYPIRRLKLRCDSAAAIVHFFVTISSFMNYCNEIFRKSYYKPPVALSTRQLATVN